MMEEKANLFIMSFDNGVTWLDVTHVVKSETLIVDTFAFNDSFRSAQNTASFQMIYEPTIYGLLRSTETDVLIRMAHVAQSGTTLGSGVTLGSGITLSELGVAGLDEDDYKAYPIFAGHFYPAIGRTYDGDIYNTIIQIDATDSSDLLSVAVGDILYRSTTGLEYYVCNPAVPTRSITHLLANIAGFPNSRISNQVSITETLIAFSPDSEEDTVFDCLDTLLYEFGYALSFDELDRIKPKKWVRASGEVETFTFDETNIGNSLTESVSPRQYDGVETTYFEVNEGVTTEGTSDILIYRDATFPYASSGGFSGYSIPAGLFYPLECNVTDEVTGQPQIVYQAYEDNGIKYYTNKAIVNQLDINRNAVSSDFSSIIATYDHAIEWLSNDPLLTLESGYPVYYNKKARVLFKNSDTVAHDLYYLNIRAKVLYRTAERLSKNSTGALATKILRYVSQYLYTKTAADAFTNALAKQVKIRSVYYTFNSTTRRDVGELVKVVLADGTSDFCLIMQRTLVQSAYKWKYKLKKYSFADTTITQQTVYAMSTPTPIATQYVGRYLGAYTSVPSMQTGDWFLYTGTTTGSLTKGRIYVSS